MIKNKNKNKHNYYKMIAFGDRHTFSNDPRIDDILLQIIQACKEDLRFIIDLGDGINADCISSYDKNLSQLNGLQDELNNDYNFRNNINQISPHSAKILLKCNHFTSRFNKLKAKEYWMTDLELLEQENLFKLKELKWELRDEWIWGKNKILFMHGDGGLGVGSQKNVINTSRALAKENHISIVRGHSHTTGYEVHRKFGELLHCIQIGTMYDLRKAPNYIKSGQYLSNWTNSIGVFYCKSNGEDFFYQPIVINDGECFFEGRHYYAK